MTMEITQARHNDVIELRLAGRLDSAWSDHLAAVVSDVIRAGNHRIALDMEGVGFLTSAGIRVLVKFHKQLKGIGGRLAVIRPSPFVSDVLGSMGLSSLVATDDVFAAPRADDDAPGGLEVQTENALFKLDRCVPGAGLACRILGDPASLTSPDTDFAGAAVDCTPGAFSLGIGAPGASFQQCRAQLGEFLAVGGAAAFLPAGHDQTPDDLLAQGTFVPRVHVLAGLECQGEFSTAMSFQAAPDRSVPLSELAAQCLAAARSDTVGIVMTAEIDGLVGAWLRRSPLDCQSPADPFAFPQIRDFLRFTAERAFTSEVALVAGVASRAAPGALAPSLRALELDGSLLGHFHAAAFTYRPLRKSSVALADAVDELFRWQTLRGLVHLIHDTRPAEGLGQSEFVRGTCWLAPITRVLRAGAPKPTKGD